VEINWIATADNMTGLSDNLMSSMRKVNTSSYLLRTIIFLINFKIHSSEADYLNENIPLRPHFSAYLNGM